MSSKLSESLIASNLAEQVCQQITRKVISSLQALKNALCLLNTPTFGRASR